MSDKANWTVARITEEGKVVASEGFEIVTGPQITAYGVNGITSDNDLSITTSDGLRIETGTEGLRLINIPAYNPLIVGAVYNDSGTLKISAG